MSLLCLLILLRLGMHHYVSDLVFFPPLPPSLPVEPAIWLFARLVFRMDLTSGAGTCAPAAPNRSFRQPSRLLHSRASFTLTLLIGPIA
jgi:hypothetical protein